MQAKEWLLRGAIDPEDKRLQQDLIAPAGGPNRQGKLVIEPKSDVSKRLGRSPDDADSFCLCFSQPVSPTYDLPEYERRERPRDRPTQDGWMSY
jgi:hypothetical protein